MLRTCLAAVTLLALAAGCGGNEAGLARVSGRVTMDGQPLAGAQVLFTPTTPADGSTYSGTQSAGFTDAEGKYQLESYNAGAGAVVGVHKIMITKSTDAAGAAGKIDPSLASVAEDLPDDVVSAAGMIPARYNSSTKLSFEVPPAGTDQANFDLSSK